MIVHISTPSRMHFGLLRFGQERGPSYGGLGMMIAAPRWEIDVAPAAEWSAAGRGATRALKFAQRALSHLGSEAPCRALAISIRRHVPLHRGFGGGTQLALAVTAAVRKLAGLPATSANELANISGRGLRSAVGSHGFVHGGLIWESGRHEDSVLGELASRSAIPSQWRIVVAVPRESAGLSGAAERRAFAQLPPAPEEATRRLIHLAEQEIVPAAQSADCERFGEAVFEYGRLAGECFAPVQGGPYATPLAARCVAKIREWGIRGVGQSSWGPTIFAIVADQQEAESIQARLPHEFPDSIWDVRITQADNRGAVVTADAAGRLQQPVSDQRLA